MASFLLIRFLEYFSLTFLDQRLPFNLFMSVIRPIVMQLSCERFAEGEMKSLLVLVWVGLQRLAVRNLPV